MKTAKSPFPVPLWLILLVGIIAISFSSIFVRWSDAPASVIAMHRLFLTNILLLPFLFSHRSEVRAITVRDWFLLIGSGFALAMHFLFWMESLRFTTVASSTAILTLEPIFVAVGSYLIFKHGTNRLGMMGMAIAIIGAVSIGWGDFGLSGTALHGDLLSLIGTFAVALHILSGKDMRERVSAFVYSFFVFFIAGFTMLVFNLIDGHPIVHYPKEEWGIFLLLAVVPTVFGHYLLNWLLKYVNATTVSMTVLGEPVGASLLAWVLLGERMTWIQGVACFLLLFGVWLFIKSDEVSRKRKRQRG